MKICERIIRKCDEAKGTAFSRMGSNALAKLKTSFPNVYKGAKRDLDDFKSIDDSQLFELEDGTKIIRVWTPGHSWFYTIC